MNGGKSGQMALQTRPHLQNQAIGWLQSGCRSFGGSTVVRFPRIWGLSGKCRFEDRSGLPHENIAARIAQTSATSTTTTNLEANPRPWLSKISMKSVPATHQGLPFSGQT